MCSVACLWYVQILEIWTEQIQQFINSAVCAGCCSVRSCVSPHCKFIELEDYAVVAWPGLVMHYCSISLAGLFMFCSPFMKGFWACFVGFFTFLLLPLKLFLNVSLFSNYLSKCSFFIQRDIHYFFSNQCVWQF